MFYNPLVAPFKQRVYLFYTYSREGWGGGERKLTRNMEGGGLSAKTRTGRNDVCKEMKWK